MKHDSNEKNGTSWFRSINTSKSTEKNSMYRSSHAVWTGRILFLFCLAVVAITLGLLANFFLSQSEEDLAKTQYYSIVDRALVTSKEIVVRKSLGSISMASVVEAAFPNSSFWPFVALNGYELIAQNIIATSSGRELALCPIVKPELIVPFETFAKDYYTKTRVPPFPNNTGEKAGVSSFGFGIFGIDRTLPNTTDQRFRYADGNTSLDTVSNLVLPVLQHSSGVHSVLLLNVRFEKSRRHVIDGVIECARIRQLVKLTDGNQTAYKDINCGGITDMIALAGVSYTPGALIAQPVFPYNDDTTVRTLLKLINDIGSRLQCLYRL
jgi:hypothetical protein